MSYIIIFKSSIILNVSDRFPRRSHSGQNALIVSMPHFVYIVQNITFVLQNEFNRDSKNEIIYVWIFLFLYEVLFLV